MEPGYDLLPKRRKNEQESLSCGNKQDYLTNYYEIRLGQKDYVVYQYSLKTDPELPADSSQLLKQIVFNVKKELRAKIGYLTAHGNMIWGTKGLNIALSIISEFRFNDQPYKFLTQIQPVKELRIQDLETKEEGLPKIFQIYNNKIKEKLRQMKMVELSRGKYFNNEMKADDEIHQAGLRVMRGYKFTLCRINSQLLLQIDVCSRVVRMETLLDTISKMSKDKIEMELKDAIVVTRYGRRRTYKLVEVDFSKSPKSQFYNEKKAGKITYAKYYQENYGIDVSEKNQPLFKAISRVEKTIIDGKIVEKPIEVYLLPELVHLTGMSDEQRKNFNIMKMLAPFTKLSPQERVSETQRLKEILNKEEPLVGEPAHMHGFLLPPPEIRIMSGTFKSQNGNLNFRDQIKQPYQFKDWLFVYSEGHQKDRDRSEADDAFSLMKQAQKAYGISFSKPGFLVVNGKSVKEWIDLINDDVQRNGKPQIIVLFLSNYEEKMYGELKRFISCQLAIPSQAIRKRTFASKNPLSAASKVILQMNAKIGGTLWETVKRNKYFDKRRIMYGGLSLSKGKKGFTLGFVGTINNQLSHVFNSCKIGIQKKEAIPQGVIEKIFVNWAKNYAQSVKDAPQTIIIYRQGLSDNQIRAQVGRQLDALHAMCKKIGEKLNKEDYRPEIMYITVNKRVTSRFYSLGGGKHPQGKFMPKVNNPDPGSIILDEMSIDDKYDFHLAAQQVTQGTCTPTHYVVAYDNSRLPQDALTQFTNEQCYNYYNWAGAVKVPACLQSASKLAKIVGESILSEVEGPLQKTFFFL